MPGSAAPADPGRIEAERVDPTLFTFAYESIAPSGYMDQTLTIRSVAQVPVVLTAALTALDADGVPMPGVTTGSVYGSHERRMVVLPGENIDVLRFDGESGGLTRDVRVDVTGVEPVDFPLVSGYVEVTPTDSSGTETDDPFEFTELVLDNSNAEPVTVRVVYLAWDAAGPGESQQVHDAVELVPVTAVPAGAQTTVELPPELLAEFQESGYGVGSYKAYYSVDPDGIVQG